MEYIVTPKIVADIVDVLVKKRRLGSTNGMVDSKRDWEIVEDCFEVFAIVYPEDVKVFIDTQKKVRDNLKYETGAIEEGEARMQHMMNMPQKFYLMVSKLYPQQKWDRDFVMELAKRMPVLSVPKHL